MVKKKKILAKYFGPPRFCSCFYL